jgi:hypothetical protein
MSGLLLDVKDGIKARDETKMVALIIACDRYAHPELEQLHHLKTQYVLQEQLRI